MNQLLKSFKHLRLATQSPSGSIVVKVLASEASREDDPLQLNVNYTSRRHGRRYRKWHHWPNDFLPFKYERAKQDPPYLRTGDAIRDVGKWSRDSLLPGAEHSKLLQSAPEIVRRQFTLEFAERKDVVEFQRRKLLDMVRWHPFDDYSSEARIANYTIRIRDNMNHFVKVDPYNARRKISQNTAVNKRGVLLKELYYQDRERFDRIVKILGISFTPTKLGEHQEIPLRKRVMRRLTKEYCERLKDEKLDAYHNVLKAKQEQLKEEISKFEALLQEDEKYLGINNPAPSLDQQHKSSS